MRNHGAAAGALYFSDDIRAVEHTTPSPLPRVVLYLVLALIGCTLAWAFFGKLDVVAVTWGKLVPQSYLKIVQPAEAGVVREILVREGQSVATGDVLVRMDAGLSEADLRALAAERTRKRLQLRRIDAELTGGPLVQTDEDAADIVTQVEAQLQARRRAHLDTLGAEKALRSRAEHDLGSAMEIEAKLRQTAPIFREQEQAWEQLAKEGFAGRLLALDRQRSRIEVEQELKAQTRNIESLKATITQADQRIAQIQSTYRQQLHIERAEAETAYQKLQQEWEKQQHRHALLELKAPQNGIVKDLATHTPGTVLAPGTIVLTLVPQNEPLVAEVWLGNADAGFVREGQKARVKLAPYPFQKYGVVDGTVRQVSADAQDRNSAANGGAKQWPDLAYRMLITLDAGSADLESRRLRLTAGMAVVAEVQLGERSVMEYLLSPIHKAVAEAGRER